MVLDKPHAFAQTEAVERIKALTHYWSKKYGVKVSWQADAATVDGNVKGIKFNGQLRVEPSRITADIKAGFLAEKLGGRKYVEEKLALYLDPKNTLESLQQRA